MIKLQKITKFFSLALCIWFLLSSCGTTKHRRNGKLKPGKPIPCPLKDC